MNTPHSRAGPRPAWWVFLNNLTSFEEQLKHGQGEFMEKSEHLCQLQQEEQFKVKFKVRSSGQPDARSLSFKLSCEFQQEVEFDVQPAYDVLYEHRNLQHFDSNNYSTIYAQLVCECSILKKEGEFSICFTDLQHNFPEASCT
ncbi:2'-5' oligoadenylate synthetase 1F [Apodemus speciosus]|uniref:2'-5' oligoadenylate synthetase 1F n=1 Tax=Apodemus speciosus TaxID=105296 RepID=A0ABQ0ESS8_APOSI